MKQIHKVRLKLSRGPSWVSGGESITPRCCLLPSPPHLPLIFVLIILPKEDHSPFYSQDVVRMDRPCFLPPQTSQCMWLMQALGFLLSALQVEEILKNLHSLISPYIQQLEKLAEEIVSELWGSGAALGPRGFSVSIGVGMLELSLRSGVE